MANSAFSKQMPSPLRSFGRKSAIFGRFALDSVQRDKLFRNGHRDPVALHDPADGLVGRSRYLQLRKVVFSEYRKMQPQFLEPTSRFD